MRWEALFADLEGEFAAAQAADLDVEVRDRARREVATLRLLDRLRSAEGHEVSLHLAGAGAVRGRLAALGAGWVLVAETAGLEALVPLAAVLSVTGLGALSATPGSEGQVAARLDLGYALRGLSRRREQVALVLTDGTVVHGTIDRVGADFVEVAEHPAGEARRPAAVRAVRTLPLAALALVRSG